MSTRIDSVRSFNRFVTSRAGALQSGLLGTEHPLADARLLFELAQDPLTEVSDLRERLALDSGHLSRLLGRLEEQGLVARERSEVDRRRQLARLTDGGRAAFELLDRRSSEQAGRLLAPLSESDQRRLVGAMDTVRRLLSDRRGERTPVLRAPVPGDYGWIVERHGVLYDREQGWDARFEALVARIVAEQVEGGDTRRAATWIAEVDGERAGCVLCVPEDERTAKLRLLLVEPWARGSGLGGRLVEECLRFARRGSCSRVTLWTNDVLTAARRIYEAAGFELVREEPHTSFGHDLVGQYWQLEL